MIKMHKNKIKILVVLTVTFLMAGCNGGGGGSSSGITTGTVVASAPIIEEPLYVAEVVPYTGEISTDVYTGTAETIVPSANPEPATLTLLGLGLLGLLGFKRNKL